MLWDLCQRVIPAAWTPALVFKLDDLLFVGFYLWSVPLSVATAFSALVLSTSIGFTSMLRSYRRVLW